MPLSYVGNKPSKPKNPYDKGLSGGGKPSEPKLMPGPKKKLGGTAKMISPAAHKRQTAMYEGGKRKRPPQKPVAGAKYGDHSGGGKPKPPRLMKPVKPPVPGSGFPSDRPGLFGPGKGLRPEMPGFGRRPVPGPGRPVRVGSPAGSKPAPSPRVLPSPRPMKSTSGKMSAPRPSVPKPKRKTA